LEIVLFWIKKWKQLRVAYEDIYVTTVAMSDLQHHRCAATQRPVIYEHLLRIHLPDERARNSKQPRPIRPWFRGAHAANG
jgi:hypothetical protein